MHQNELLSAFLERYPNTARIEVLVPDINGIFRGKWLPIEQAEKLINGGARMPVAVYCQDIWGHDVDAAGVAGPRGDPDGVLVPDLSTLKPVPWSDQNAAQVICTIKPDDEATNPYDPRAILAQVEQSFTNQGFNCVMACELEFNLFRERRELDEAPRPPRMADGSNLYDLETQAELEPFFQDVRSCAAKQDIPVDVMFGEYAAGQYEINLKHCSGAVKAADNGILLKRLVRQVARKHGLEASFMARAYGDQVGSSQHVHVSLLDQQGRNLFAGDAEHQTYSQGMLHAISGLMATMPDFQLLFAPTNNSYRRLAQPYFEAIGVAWGDDNRNLSIRVPEFLDPKAARIEHRLPGADANPYLCLAALLAGIDFGLKQARDPAPKRQIGDPLPEQVLARSLFEATKSFGDSSLAKTYFGAEFARVFAINKQEEAAAFNDIISGFEYKTYANKV